MNKEQELKDKIVEVIKRNGVFNGENMHHNYYVICDNELADALIAAGLKFNVNYSFTAAFNNAQAEREHDLECKLTAAEHGAEVTERAFRDFLAEYFTAVNEQNSYDCGVPEMFGRYANVLPYEDIVTSRLNEYLKQAEKELAEEKQ